MRRSFKKWPLMFALCVTLFSVNVNAQTAAPHPTDSPQVNDAEAPLTNTAVMKLVRAGFSEKTVIAIIRSRPTRFDLAPDRLIELKKHGVSEHVILAMLARDGSVNMASDAGGDSLDDPFFDMDGVKRQRGTTQPSDNNDPNETNIFGSSGGSHGRTTSRGAGQTSSGDSQATGSATVRILRPATEAGGAPPRLERTPTLTNESVIELVEAGFSEGTIIRRIESSPAEYDFTPTKLAELKKRRVSDPVIAAMRAAMGDEANMSARPER